MEHVWTVQRPPMGRDEIARQNELFRGAVKNLMNYVKIPERFLEARKIEIICPGGMEVTFSGRKGSIKGISFVSQSISNPNPLNITIQRGSLILDPVKPSNLFIRGEGIFYINGGRAFDPMRKIEQTRKLLQPAKDPDLTSVDGMEFRKTGTVEVLVEQGALIIIS